MRILKFILKVTDLQTISMPRVVKMLDVQMQHGECYLWALCDEAVAVEQRHIVMHGTGHPMPDDPGAYIATFQALGGAVVFHVFNAGVEQ